MTSFTAVFRPTVSKRPGNTNKKKRKERKKTEEEENEIKPHDRSFFVRLAWKIQGEINKNTASVSY